MNIGVIEHDGYVECLGCFGEEATSFRENSALYRPTRVQASIFSCGPHQRNAKGFLVFYEPLEFALHVLWHRRRMPRVAVEAQRRAERLARGWLNGERYPTEVGGEGGGG